MWMSVLRLLSGIWIPLFLFPAMIASFLQVLPFAHLVSTPIQVILGELSVADALAPLCILLVWTAILALISQLVWKKALTAYESTGI
jgi:ABC-2 type transport system permease protein